MLALPQKYIKKNEHNKIPASIWPAPEGNETKNWITAEFHNLPLILINTGTKYFGLGVLLHGNTERRVAKIIAQFWSH